MEFSKLFFLRVRFFYLLMVLVLFVVSCGVKAEPVAIRDIKLHGVGELRHAIKEEGFVTLTWNLDRFLFETEFCNSALLVYISEESLKNPYCPNCPINFSCDAEFELRDMVIFKESRVLMSYRGKVTRGNRYFYKFKLRTKDSSVKVFSNVIHFEYPYISD